MFDYEELEEIKKYMENLSERKDPFTNIEIEKIDLVDNYKIVEAFKKISILIDTILKSYSNIVKNRNVKENESEIKSLKNYKNYIEITSNPIPISYFVKSINKNIEGCKLKTSDISKWLVKNGYLDEVINKEHQKFKSLNEKSYGIGLTSIEKENYIGEKYQTILYTEKAQKFIIDNLEKIINKDI